MPRFFTIKRKFLLFVAATLFLINIFAWQEVFILAGPRYLRVVVMDVGQGDSIFIETPSKRRIIIDGGPSSKVLEKISPLLPRFDKSLDAVILTHPDADHLTGLLHIMKRYKVGYIIWTGILKNDANYKQWLNLAEQQERRGTKMVFVKAGDKIINGEVTMDILHPFEDLSGRLFAKNTNDTGVVSRLSYKNNSFMLTGDITSDVEKNIVANYRGERADASLSGDENVYNPNLPELKSDVAQTPHHGSKTSSSEEFLSAISPSAVFISVGRNNSYGHPAPEVLQKLEEFGANIFRTDENGDIVMISDGNNIVVK